MTDSPSSAAGTRTSPVAPAEFLWPGEQEQTPTPEAATTATVTAVIVSRDGARWLPQLLRALPASTRPLDRVLAVDAGSTDDSRSLLARSCSRVVDVPTTTGFGAAVQAAVRTLPEIDDAVGEEWLWLLHDDCLPAPDALAELLDVAARDPRIAAVGGRLRAWPRARRLLEVGVTITGTGHREPGVELGEFDQGQHSQQRDVLAVSSAGMLVRRRVWDELSGFDPELPLFRDDVDFGWRAARAGHRVVLAPSAVVFHAEAAARGVRPLTTRRGRRLRPHRLDRRAAVFVLLANCSAAALVPQYIRLGLGSLLRALGYLLGKLPTAALDEVAGAGGVLARPHRLVAARARRRRTARVPARDVRHLLPPWWTPYRNGLELLVGRAAERVLPSTSSRSAPQSDALDSGPVADEAMLATAGEGVVPWLSRHRLAVLVLALTVAAAVASRGLWGSGLLQGGGLLPAPSSAGAWWDRYLQTWHPVGLGSPTPPAPYVVVLAGLGSLAAGKAWLVVDLLMLFAVPLCALGAYAGSRRLVRGRGARLWLAATYATVPVVTGAVTAGRLGTTVVAIGLPWLLAAVLTLVTGADRAASHVRAAAATAAVLSVLTAFAPLLWPLAAAAGVLGALWCLLSRQAGRAVALLAAVAAPAALLLPWTQRLLARPETFLAEAGWVAAAAPTDPRWQLALGRLGAPGDAPAWLSAGVVAVAVLALLRRDRRPAIAAAWTVVAVALGTAAVVADRTVAVPGTGERAPVWLGVPVVVALGAGLLAAAVAADGLPTAVRSGSFGWKQPLAGVAAVAALASTLAAVAWWVVTAPAGDLDRAPASVLPAYMSDAMTSAASQRVLVLDTRADVVRYRLLSGDGLRLGDESSVPGESAGVTDLVGDLLSSASPDDVDRLAEYGVAYVVLTSPHDTVAAAALDALPRLTRASTDVSRLLGWQVDLPTGYARLVDPDRRDSAATAQVLPSDAGTLAVDLDRGTASRRLVLATPAAGGLAVTFDGRTLERVDGASTSSYAVGGAAGPLRVAPGDDRRRALVLQLALWLVLLALAAPAIDRRGPSTSSGR